MTAFFTCASIRILFLARRDHPDDGPLEIYICIFPAMRGFQCRAPRSLSCGFSVAAAGEIISLCRCGERKLCAREAFAGLFSRQRRIAVLADFWFTGVWLEADRSWAGFEGFFEEWVSFFFFLIRESVHLDVFRLREHRPGDYGANAALANVWRDASSYGVLI